MGLECSQTLKLMEGRDQLASKPTENWPQCSREERGEGGEGEERGEEGGENSRRRLRREGRQGRNGKVAGGDL